MIIRLASLFLFCASSMALASTPQADAAVETQAKTACSRASGFERPVVSTAVRFSDDTGVDARLVTGIYPQAHMKRAQGLMLCLYDRRSRRAEVQDAEGWWARRKR